MHSVKALISTILLASTSFAAPAAEAAPAAATAAAAAAPAAACGPPAIDPGYNIPAHYNFPPHGPLRCGKTDVYFTGLPPNHPTVVSQGYPPNFVASALQADKARILAAGYNIKTILQGPEVPISNLGNGLYNMPAGKKYDAYITGAGVRASLFVNLTAHFENEIALFRQKLPFAAFGFNNSPNSSLEALMRVAPIEGNCTNTPGKDYGTYIYCDSNVCTVPYSPQIGTTYPSP